MYPASMFVRGPLETVVRVLREAAEATAVAVVSMAPRTGGTEPLSEMAPGTGDAAAPSSLPANGDALPATSLSADGERK
jgi:hypothetical protein